MIKSLPGLCFAAATATERASFEHVEINGHQGLQRPNP
jgi:hypothetical protein